MLIAVLLLATHCASASDKCQKLADVVFEEVAVKPIVISTLKKEPKEGPLGEPWRNVAFLYAEKLDKLKVAVEKQHDIAKVVIGLTFSDNPEIESNIFTEYFYLTCKREEKGEASMPLTALAPDSLLACWNSASSRTEFQGCLGKLLIPAK